MDKNLSIKLSSNILKRYEPNAGDGLFFLYNTKTQEIHSGNILLALFIKLLDGKKSINDIYSEIGEIFSEQNQEELVNKFDSVIEPLIKKNYLEYEKEYV